MSGSVGDNTARASGVIASAGGGKVLQVVQTVKTDTNTIASTSMVDLGISTTITPTSSSSKILAITYLNIGGVTGARGGLNLVRDTTDILLADTASNRIRATNIVFPPHSNCTFSINITYLDSPSTTSATTYKIQGSMEGANTLTINRTYTDTDASTHYRGTSTLTLMEIGA